MNLRELQPYVIGWIRDYLSQALAGALSAFRLTVRDLTAISAKVSALDIGTATGAVLDELRFGKNGLLFFEDNENGNVILSRNAVIRGGAWQRIAAYQEAARIMLSRNGNIYFSVATDAGATAGSVITFSSPVVITKAGEVCTVPWTNFTPALNLGGAVLSGFDQCRYMQLGKLVFFKFSCMNRNLSGTADRIGITLPVAGANKCYPLNVDAFDPVLGWRRVRCDIESSAYLFICKYPNYSTWVGNETGVYLEISGTYEVP